MRMPQRRAGNASQKINVLLPFLVIHFASFSLVDDEPVAPVGRHDIFLVLLQYLFSVHLTISVPIPFSVNISKSSECGTVPLRRCACLQPAFTASMHASTFGIIPLVMMPFEMYFRASAIGRVATNEPL